MLTSILHLIAGLLLAGASFYWLLRKADAPGAHRFLFPYTIVASATGALMIAVPLFEIWAAYYSGAIYELEVMQMRITGPYWWVYCSSLALPILPFLGFLPAIGRKPWLMAGIGIISLLPDLYLLLVPAMFSLLR